MPAAPSPLTFALVVVRVEVDGEVVRHLRGAESSGARTHASCGAPRPGAGARGVAGQGWGLCPDGCRSRRNLPCPVSAPTARPAPHLVLGGDPGAEAQGGELLVAGKEQRSDPAGSPPRRPGDAGHSRVGSDRRTDGWTDEPASPVVVLADLAHGDQGLQVLVGLVGVDVVQGAAVAGVPVGGREVDGHLGWEGAGSAVYVIHPPHRRSCAGPGESRGAPGPAHWSQVPARCTP